MEFQIFEFVLQNLSTNHRITFPYRNLNSSEIYMCHFLYTFQLAYCVVQFLEKDASLTEDVSTCIIIVPFQPQEKNNQLHFKQCLVCYAFKEAAVGKASRKLHIMSNWHACSLCCINFHGAE